MTVVDASAVLEVLLRTPAGDALEERLLGDGQALHAPHLIDLEVAQVLRRYTIAGHLTAGRGSIAIIDFGDFPIRRYRHDFLMTRIWELRDNLTAYDAAYVALAEVLDEPLITRDRKLAAATGHAARINLA